MNNIINIFHHWINQHLTLKQWLWLILLWISGIISMFVIALPIKWLIKSLG